MKRCPQCNNTYEDAKNFCLQDGTPLVADAPPAQSAHPPDASPFQHTPTPPAAWSQGGSWQQQPPTSLSGPPARQRKVWPWVLGVLGVFVLGGVALVGGVGYFVYRNVNEAQRHIEESAKETGAGEATAPVATVEESDVESAVRGALGGGEAGAPGDKGEVLEQLKEIEEEWARANIEGDKEAARRILADEYVGTSAGGATERKADYLRNLRPSEDLESQEFEDMSLVQAGGRAILTGVTVAEFKDGRSERFRFVDIFVWRDGRWQAVTSTTSPLR